MIPHRGPYPTFGTMDELKILDTLMGMALDELSDNAGDERAVFNGQEHELLLQMHAKTNHALKSHPNFRLPSP